MSSETINEGSAVSSGAIAVPSGWALEANHRYLKGIIDDLAPVGDEDKGVTQADLDAAENHAWYTILSRFVAMFDVSTWTSSPPIPLFQIWDWLASACAILMVHHRLGTTDAGANVHVKHYVEMADNMIQFIVDPPEEGQRMHLLTSAGAIVFPRTNSVIPSVVNITGTVFFPASNDEVSAWGDYPTLGASVEDFIVLHGRPPGA